MKPVISIIAAISENRVIGEGERIPWKIKEDLVRLKNLTRGQTIIIGRKTYDSMVLYYQKSGRPMPGKLYLVITRNKQYRTGFPNAQIAESIGEALQYAKKNKVPEVFVIGGGQVFTQTIPLADKLYLTIVHKKISGDAYFPDYSEYNKVISRQWGKSGEYSYTFLELEKG